MGPGLGVVWGISVAGGVEHSNGVDGGVVFFGVPVVGGHAVEPGSFGGNVLLGGFGGVGEWLFFFFFLFVILVICKTNMLLVD